MLFDKIKETIKKYPGITENELLGMFGETQDVTDTITDLLSGNWIDPDGEGGFVYRDIDKCVYAEI